MRGDSAAASDTSLPEHPRSSDRVASAHEAVGPDADSVRCPANEAIRGTEPGIYRLRLPCPHPITCRNIPVLSAPRGSVVYHCRTLPMPTSKRIKKCDRNFTLTSAYAEFAESGSFVLATPSERFPKAHQDR